MVEEGEDTASNIVPGEIWQHVKNPEDDQPKEHESCAER